jgi:hypothetical protein
MIGDLYAIYEARRDPALAARLAARLARNQALDRAFAPLFIVHMLAWVAISLCALLLAAGLMGALFGHWAWMIPALIPGGLGFLIWKVRDGLVRGEKRIRSIAEQISEQGMDRVSPLSAAAHTPETPETPDAIEKG